MRSGPSRPSTPPLVFVATAAFGFGTALYGVARFTILSDVFPEHEGAAIGITLAAGEVGNAVLPLAAGAIATTLAWQYGFWLSVPAFGLTALLLWYAVPGRTSGETSAVDAISRDTLQYVASQLRRRPIVVVTAVQILTYSVWQAFTGFYPTYLIEVKELSAPVATGCSAPFRARNRRSALTGGVYDRIGARRSLPVVLGIVAVALAALPFLEGSGPRGGTVLLSSILGYGTITLPYMTAAFPQDMKGPGSAFSGRST